MSDADNKRNPVEELAAEFLQRCRQGENPSIEQYAERYPELADEIRQLFPTMLAMEDVKVRKEHVSGGGGTRRDRPERLGDFRIIREVGRGGMGVVYEAEQESLGRRVAIKVMRRTALLGEKDIRRFERESRVAAGLHHPNIVQVYGVGEEGAYLYYVMQLIQGVGLDEVIDRLGHEAADQEDIKSSVRTETFASDCHGAGGVGNKMPPPRGEGPADVERIGAVCSHLAGTSRWRAVASIGLQIAQALDYAHGEGAIHRDIKPANLLVDEDLTVWVADFGLAKATHTDDLTMTGDLAGTLRYMAPEQFRGKADFRTDIHALGLTLYELLAGRPAHPESDRTSLIQTIIHKEPDLLSNEIISTDGGEMTLKVSKEPRYIEFSGDVEAFERSLEAARYDNLRPVQITVRDINRRIGDDAVMPVTLKNAHGVPIEGTARVEAEGLSMEENRLEFTLGPAEQKIHDFTVSDRTGEGNGFPFSVRVDTDRGAASLEETVYVSVITRGTPQIDGNPAEWPELGAGGGHPQGGWIRLRACPAVFGAAHHRARGRAAGTD
jgi:hypothetical protein